MGAAKDKFKPLTWKVKYYDCNANKIVDYDVLKYQEGQIKKFKKLCDTKEEFAEKLRVEFQWRYWSKCECELVIEIDGDNHVWLRPWIGCSDHTNVKIDVTNDESFDWMGFAREHISKQRHKNSAKIDIYDQLMYAKQFEKLVDYCWYTHLKYERKNKKFDKKEVTTDGTY